MRYPADWSVPATTVPAAGAVGTLVGRVWDPVSGGPSPVLVSDQGVFDLSAAYPTVRDLCEQDAPVDATRRVSGRRIGSLEEILAATLAEDHASARLLAPVDLQVIKAAGVTFSRSMVERVVEEQSAGGPAAARVLREQIVTRIGVDLGAITPGSEHAKRLKAMLIERGAWSQYLEVGLGADAEIFTKAPSLAAVGSLACVGIPPSSTWNNPEPEVALVLSSSGRIVGVTLANDVNLRDVEGRSALLLPQAKDNNASCALGPLVRLFDDTFTLESVRTMTLRLEVFGDDGFELRDSSSMSDLSRSPEGLVSQLFRHHHYPDGAVLMLGTPFAPTVDRDAQGRGFTHHRGDIVRISAPELGALVNLVQYCGQCPPWIFGIRDLMENLAQRHLLTPS